MSGKVYKMPEQKALEGNRGKRDIPATIKPPKPDQVPVAPVDMGDAAKAEWNRLATPLWNLGLLTVLDIGTFEEYCRAWEQLSVLSASVSRDRKLARQSKQAVKETEEGKVQIFEGSPDKQLAFYRDEWRRLLKHFGLSPQERANLAAIADNEDEFSEFD
jgi:P27 family predicted phage terminase small subunit